MASLPNIYPAEAPTKNCTINEPNMVPVSMPEDWMNCMRTIVSMYAIGSLLPLSSSSMGRRLYFRFIFCDRKMAKTEAESVDDIVEASKSYTVIGK